MIHIDETIVIKTPKTKNNLFLELVTMELELASKYKRL